MTTAPLLPVPRREVYAMAAALPIVLSPEDEREVLEELVEDMIDEWWETLDAAFPPDESGITNPLPGKARLQLYLDRTMTEDLALLLEENAAELIDARLAPLPISPWWAQVATLGKREFRRTQRDFRSLFLATVKENE